MVRPVVGFQWQAAGLGFAGEPEKKIAASAQSVPDARDDGQGPFATLLTEDVPVLGDLLLALGRIEFQGWRG